MTDLNTRRTIFIHEAVRLAAATSKVPVLIKEWWDRSDAVRAQFLATVEQLCQSNADPSPSGLRRVWMDAHPGFSGMPLPQVHSLAPFDELYGLEINKDAIFAALCVIARNWIQ